MGRLMETKQSPPDEASVPLIALVGATAAAIPPTMEAFRKRFPEARLWNLLDDRLITDAIDAGRLTEKLHKRMSRLIDYALDGGATGVLLTCSMYGPVAHEAAESADVPILAADDAAFEDIAASGWSRIALVSSLPAALASAEQRLRGFLVDRTHSLEFIGVLAAPAFQASIDGDVEGMAVAVVEAVAAVDPRPDAVFLAQYSLTPAADAIADATELPVLSGPGTAALALRTAILRAR